MRRSQKKKKKNKLFRRRSLFLGPYYSKTNKIEQNKKHIATITAAVEGAKTTTYSVSKNMYGMCMFKIVKTGICLYCKEKKKG